MSAILKAPSLQLRPMSDEDLQQVFETEQAAYTHPWTKGILHDCIHSGYCCLVAELDGKMVGHGVMSVAIGEAHLLNICISPSMQGQGLGRRLLRRMIRRALERNADTLFLEVRMSNHAARGLYESEGFCEVGRRRGYYPADDHNREDAMVYAKPLF